MRKGYYSYLTGIILSFSITHSYAQENASNPLAAVSNTDLRYQFIDLGDANLNEYWIDGAYMATPNLKLKYEIHYWNLCGWHDWYLRRQALGLGCWRGSPF
jgi:hypothetical protein